MFEPHATTIESMNADPNPIKDELRKIGPIVYASQLDEWLVPPGMTAVQLRQN